MNFEDVETAQVADTNPSPDAAYANGWYDKTRDDGVRFWALQPHVDARPQSYLRDYLRGLSARPDSGIRGVSTDAAVDRADAPAQLEATAPDSDN
jgi:hypothetical protein